MAKKIISLFLALVLSVGCILSLASCGDDADLKVGAILIGDESEGYTLAHMTGLEAAVENIANELGKKVKLIYKKCIPESSAVNDNADLLVADGCKLIVANSYGHQDYMVEAAKKYADVAFVSMTGDFASICGVSNFSNAFTRVYESRYVSGVVAGLKLQELVNNDKLLANNYMSGTKGDGNIKIGYVGAFPYAEVISGYTAFFLGIRSVVSNVEMEVVYTNSWFSIPYEGQAADYLMAQGCVIIGQHADSTGAPVAVDTAHKNQTYTNVYSVGYNVDMTTAAPTVALTSAANNWSVYYTTAFKAVLNGEKVPTNWSEGYDKDAVCITKLGTACAADTAKEVADVIAALKNGTLKVFDTSKFTVEGQSLTTAKVDLSYRDWGNGGVAIYDAGSPVEALKTEGAITYFDESTLRSAPYFSLAIDGINANTTWKPSAAN